MTAPNWTGPTTTPLGVARLAAKLGHPKKLTSGFQTRCPVCYRWCLHLPSDYPARAATCCLRCSKTVVSSLVAAMAEGVTR